VVEYLNMLFCKFTIENRLTFGEVVGNSLVSFFLTAGACVLKAKLQNIYHSLLYADCPSQPARYKVTHIIINDFESENLYVIL